MSQPRPLHVLIVACLALTGLPAPAWAQDAAVGSFQDVPIDHWAFLTVETLVRKYGVMAGFPDGSFGGKREVSRYELAAALTKVLARMGPGTPAADVEAARAAAGALDLTGLKARIEKLEADLKAATTVGPAAVRVGGGSSTVWMDNTQDAVNPYLKTGLGVSLNARVADWDMEASMWGDVPGATVGNKPGTAGGDKPPENTNWHFGSAHVTTAIADTKLRLGYYKPEAFFDAGSGIPSEWEGLVGNGLLDPWVSSTRWGDKNAAIAATRELGPLALSAAVTPTVVLAGLSARVTDWVTLKGTLDTDQPDWWGVNPARATARNFTAIVDLGGDGPVAGSVGANYAKDLITASAQVTWAFAGSARLNAGVVYKESEKAVTELTPGVSLWLPSLAPPLTPTVLLGVKEPQVLSAQDPKVVPGPGSLLGEQAGVTARFDWTLEDAGLPNFTFEYNIQQPVLLYSIYDATFAFKTGRGF